LQGKIEKEKNGRGGEKKSISHKIRGDRKRGEALKKKRAGSTRDGSVWFSEKSKKQLMGRRGGKLENNVLDQ